VLFDSRGECTDCLCALGLLSNEFTLQALYLHVSLTGLRKIRGGGALAATGAQPGITERPCVHVWVCAWLEQTHGTDHHVIRALWLE
jgi:hypothetical protein